MHRYSEAVKADVRRRMSQPHQQSVARISEEPVGGLVRRLVQLPASPQRPGRGDLTASECRLRVGPTEASAPLVTLHSVLASTRSGLDQSTTP